MANYASSLLVDGQAKLLAGFQSNELRFRDPVITKSLIGGASFMFPDASTLKTADDRAVKTYYQKRTARSLGSARVHEPSGANGDSNEMALTYASFTDKFSLSLKQGGNNLFKYEEQFMGQMQNVIANFAEGLETESVDFLFTNRTGVNNATVEGTFEATNDVFEITESTNGTRTAQIIKTVLDINKYSGVQLDVYCDTVMYNKLTYQLNQGSANVANLTFQFGNLTLIHVPELTALAIDLDATYSKGFALAVPMGTVGVLDWIPLQNRQGVVTQVNSYGTLINPVDSLLYATYTWEQRADGSSRGGQVQDVLTNFEFSIDLSYNKAPLSVANETTIYAFALV